MDKELFKKAEAILKESYGEKAGFREGQYEAIEATVKNKRTIVVQKTGWGKSLVYFISAKMLREKGMTVVVSPLLILMDNQKEAAEKLGLRCLALNSSVKNKAERQKILTTLLEGRCDVFFTTPETLFRKEVMEIFPRLRIALFVVDECHCISDWGHDFRLEYGKLYKIIARLSENVSVLGTTATANDRVVEDLKAQFGNGVYVSRGPLTRESLHIQVLKLETKAERYAWLKKNLNLIPGSGIIYCSTQRDCDQLAAFLQAEGIQARPYHSGKNIKDTIPETEKMLKENQLKAIVATIKLGMGYDKEDIGFVIHFQRPSSLVAYYQQIGRAGRKEGMEAYCYLMTGKEDREISEYFIANAFPEEEQEEAVVNALNTAGPEGLTLPALQEKSNISKKALERAVMFLMHQNVIYQNLESDKGKYARSANPYHYQGAYYEKIREIKLQELDAVDRFADTSACYSRFVVNELNDAAAKDCGKCANCLKKDILEGIGMPGKQELAEVQEYLGSLYLEIIPRLKWMDRDNPFDPNTMIKRPNETGLALSKYNDAGYGRMVAQDKYRADEFQKELVEKAAAVLKERLMGEGYTLVTSIPSARNGKVAQFAERLAEALGMEYRELLCAAGEGAQQKTMQNSYFQYRNAVAKIRVKEGAGFLNRAGVILVDDLVDSKWTLTVAGGRLKKLGAGKVFPFCLADSSRGGEDN